MREQSGKIPGVGGLQLFYRRWEPEGEPKASIVLVHGAGEHIGRYEHMAAWFAEQGFAVWAMDHRGHGQSEGQRLFINRFEEYLLDLRSFVAMVTEQQAKPVMIGHSMGGLISYQYACAFPDSIAGLVLSSPWFNVKVKPWERAAAPILSALAPRLQMASPIRPERVTCNPAVHARDRQDPHIAQVMTPRWFHECSQAATACQTSLEFPSTLPVLFQVSGGDVVVDPDATRVVFNRVGHDRKTYRLYPEKFHEIYNDPGYEALFEEIVAWLTAQGILQA